MLGANWKTTLTGICMILGAIANAGMDYLQGKPVDLPVTIAAITAGIGLIMAKDAGVTGVAK